MTGSIWKPDSCWMTATTAHAFCRVGGRPSSVKLLAISAVQPDRSEMAGGRALATTARTSASRATLDPWPAQLASSRPNNQHAASRHGENTRRGLRAGWDTFIGLALAQL